LLARRQGIAAELPDNLTAVRFCVRLSDVRRGDNTARDGGKAGNHKRRQRVDSSSDVAGSDTDLI
jgi:hypothetical protein